MEQRALIAVVLSIVVIYFFQAYFASHEKPQPPAHSREELDLYSADDKPSFAENAGEDAGLELPEPPSSGMGPEPDPGKEVRVDTNLYTALFSTRGAVLKSFILKKYLDKLGKDGRPVEMVTGRQADQLSLAFALVGKESTQTDTVLFDVDKDSIDLTLSDAPGKIVFSGTTVEGIKVSKAITFLPDSYLITIDVDVVEPASTAPHRGAVISWTRILDPEKDKSSRLGFTGPAAYADGRLYEVKLKDLDNAAETFSNDVSWAGYEDKYFMAAFLSRREVTSLIARMSRPAENTVVVSCYDQGLDPTVGEEVRYSYGFFCGPKDIDVLNALDMNLAKAIDFGMFDAIAKPMLYALKYVNSITYNYGVAIIIITIILKAATFPLTHKSYKSMKSLKDLQPKIEALKKKYKDDREKLNVETINLYRSHKVNPLGGCLPMLIQFPIFIAFYWVLLGSIELRHSPFILWIKDLSAHDPYYITPLLMGASMFITQKMTPTSADPTQAKMMLAMPVIFTVLFLKFPAGLVIYWLVNNILQILQQIYIDKRVS